MEQITVTTTVHAPLAKVWECWNEPEHISGWAFASPDWGAEGLENDLRDGGIFKSRMFAKDGSMSFDFEGTYTHVEPQQYLAYTMSDGRMVSVHFEETGDEVHITESFDPEQENPVEKQHDGWQAYLDNFKRYVEGL